MDDLELMLEYADEVYEERQGRRAVEECERIEREKESTDTK